MPEHALAGSQPRFCPRALLRIGVGSIAGLLLAVCFFLAGRRASGAFDQPLSSPTLLSLGIAIAVLASGLRIAWPRSARWTDSASGITLTSAWTRLILPSVAVLLFCYALSLPGSAPWSVALLWFLVVSEEGAWWLAEAFDIRAVRTSASLADGTPRKDPAQDNQAAHVPLGLELPDEDEDAGLITQQITRLRDEDGRELIFGQASAEFVAGERSQSIHLAFCPPLSGNPRMTALHAGGPSATITVTQAEPFGARLDVRLAATARQPERVMVEFEAHGPAAVEPGAPD